MPRAKETALARLIKQRRASLGLSQRELARRIRTSAGFISQLELGKRRPSYKRLALLAKVLGVDQRELFCLANPTARQIVDQPANDDDTASAWEQFINDHVARRAYHILDDEMEVLSCVRTIGEVRSPREFIYILNTLRYAVGR